MGRGVGDFYIRCGVCYDSRDSCINTDVFCWMSMFERTEMERDFENGGKGGVVF